MRLAFTRPCRVVVNSPLQKTGSNDCAMYTLANLQNLLHEAVSSTEQGPIHPGSNHFLGGGRRSTFSHADALQLREYLAYLGNQTLAWPPVVGRTEQLSDEARKERQVCDPMLLLHPLPPLHAYMTHLFIADAFMGHYPWLTPQYVVSIWHI
jgi:hypothetical protein